MCHTRIEGAPRSTSELSEKRLGRENGNGSSYSSTHEDPPIGWLSALLTYISYAVLIGYGHMRDFLGTLTGISRYAVRNNPINSTALFHVKI